MYSKTRIEKFMKDYLAKITQLKEKIQSVDTVLIGAGAGLSTSAGNVYSGERFYKHFTDFHQKYGISDMYSGGFYDFPTIEEFWAWWSRQIYVNRYDRELNPVYKNLLDLVESKDYFVITTNADHFFQDTGFDKKRLFYTQGDYGLFQCSKACHQQTYDNKDIVYQMYNEQKDMKIPSSLVPYCPKCNAPMTVNLRKDNLFVQDQGWTDAYNRYAKFLQKIQDKEVLLMEFGIGGNTPSIIKYPFWDFTMKNPHATYACLNLHDCHCPRPLEERSILIEHDIAEALRDLKS